MMQNPEKVKQIKDIIAQAKDKGQIVGITFRKKDGSIRHMAFRPGATKGVKGTGGDAAIRAKFTLRDNGCLRVFDMSNGWRTANLDTASSVKFGGFKLKF